MTRIRYINTGNENVIKSSKIFAHDTNGTRYVIRIDKSDLKFEIVEDTTDMVAKTGRAVNLHQVKMKAKQALVDLGISFSQEARDREDESEESLSEVSQSA